MDYRDLPYDAEIEYLESTGEQYIKTGIIPTSDFSYEVTAEILGKYEWNPVGIWDDWVNNMFGVDLKFSVNGGILNCWGDAFTEKKVRPINTWLKISQKNGEQKISRLSDGYVYLNGKLEKTFQCSSDIYIFSLNNRNNSVFANKGRISSVIIRNNNNTLFDAIPVRVGNVGYMYDKVSGKLFGNSGTGSFVLGPDVAPGRYANEVAFLESWGNQYIDTGIKPSTDTKIELKCLYCKSGAGLTSYGSLIGADDRSNAYILNHSAVANFTYGLEFSNNFANPQTRLLTFDSTASPQNMRVYDEGGSLVTTLTCLRGVFEVNQNLYLFAVNRNGTPVYGSNRIMYCKIYDGNTLVRDYVPVEYNGIGYMYDKVSGLFFDNQGTGKFLFGSIAKACARSYTRRQLMAEHSGYERLSYISNEGHTAGGVFPYINLGIRITPTMRLYTDVQVISKSTSDIIHGVYSPSPKIMFQAVWNSARSGYRYPAQANSVSYTPESAYTKKRAQLTLDKDTYTVVRGGSTFTRAVTAGDNFKTNANFCLFFATGYQLNWAVAPMRMWSFKIWDNDVLIMDLVPVRDKSTKEIGLLNVVNHRFYGAVRGTFVGA